MDIHKSTKGISPVLMVLLMIAVAVGAAVVTQFWGTNYVGDSMTRVEHVIWIPSVKFTDGDGATAITIYVQNIKHGTVQLTNVYVNRVMVSNEDVTMSDDGLIKAGETCTINVINQSIEKEAEVRIMVTCIDGLSTEGVFEVRTR